MMNFTKYEKYKDSGLEWLGEIPQDWESKRIKDILAGAAYGTSESTNENGTYEILGMGDIESGKISFPKKKFLDCIPEELLLRKGDLLLNRTNSLALVGKVGLVENEVGNVSFASYLIRLRLRKEINKKFYNYLANCNDFISVARANSIQTANQANLNLSKYKQLLISIPNEKLQTAIVNYLDEKTGQIDKTIELLQTKKKRYQELRKALINKAVTKGLDKTLKLKDSGVEWIGEIPTCWSFERFGDKFKLNKKKNVGLTNDNLLSLSYGKIKRKDINSSFGLLPDSFETYQIVEEGDIILRLTDLQNDWNSLRVGLVKEKGIITSAYIGLKLSKHLHPEFIYYLLHNYDIKKVFYSQGGSIRQSMKFDDIKTLPLLYPDMKTQIAIADYLNDKTSKIDQIISTIDNNIQAFSKLRKILINDTVMGKIKVI